MDQFNHVSHSELPAGPMWGYNGSYPGVTIEANSNEYALFRFVNNLPTAHLLPIDPTLHGPMGHQMVNGQMVMVQNPDVRVVPHLHGAHVTWQNDGWPDDWYLPGDQRDFDYENTQPATTLWYHDHAMGITRLNVYAGLAGFYLVRDAAEAAANLPTGDFEMPLLIQDKCYNPDGTMWFPDSRTYFDAFAGPFRTDPVTPTDVPPVWNPEFFGNAMVVNGKIWPFMDVQPAQYRFRILNACGSRFLALRLSNDAPIHQIGSDGGLMPAVVSTSQLLVAPAERMDVIIDFGAMPPGTVVELINVGPDEPFGGFNGFVPADPNTSGAIMQFRGSSPGSSSGPGSGSSPGSRSTGSSSCCSCRNCGRNHRSRAARQPAELNWRPRTQNRDSLGGRCPLRR